MHYARIRADAIAYTRAYIVTRRGYFLAGFDALRRSSAVLSNL